jgi:sugar phosphate isomerase/epimerase
MDQSKLTITIQDDGSIKINSTKMIGDEAEILAELNALAAELGADLKVEKHVHSHSHSHSHSHNHKHKIKS